MNLTVIERPDAHMDKMIEYQGVGGVNEDTARAIVSKQAEGGEAYYCLSNKTLYMPKRAWIVLP